MIIFKIGNIKFIYLNWVGNLSLSIHNEKGQNNLTLG